MQRIIPDMVERLQSPGNPVKVSLASTDYTCDTAKKVCAISSTSGSVIWVTIVDDLGTTTQHVPLPAPGMIGVQNVTVIEKSNTDAANIVCWYL